MSATAATIGLYLLASVIPTTRTTCTSTTMATSIRRSAAIAIARTVTQSVVSKNNF